MNLNSPNRDKEMSRTSKRRVPESSRTKGRGTNKGQVKRARLFSKKPQGAEADDKDQDQSEIDQKPERRQQSIEREQIAQITEYKHRTQSQNEQRRTQEQINHRADKRAWQT
ncbi:hypothetical protein TRICI_002978 [Trichomonascus ciferrii]|uniref:Uncharacterized protein n=1 Tax=Trichomonascus ciferrii TaxID=44093 RepID=A0A642V6B1_9ASCO|nr:hypothetical protein TRICI_002978 [Trichomonascus ciferrii]